MQRERDRSTSPKRKRGKKDWFKRGLSRHTLIYLHVALECDTPILEALFYAMPGCYAEWTGVDSKGLTHYFYAKLRNCFVTRLPLESWNKYIYSKKGYPRVLQWMNDARMIEIVQILEEIQTPTDNAPYLARISLYEGESDDPLDSTGVTLLRPENELVFDPQCTGISATTGFKKFDWTLPLRSGMVKEIDSMVARFCAKHHAFFQSE